MPLGEEIQENPCEAPGVLEEAADELQAMGSPGCITVPAECMGVEPAAGSDFCEELKDFYRPWGGVSLAGFCRDGQEGDGIWNQPQ